ncbi:chain-length determining protein [Paraburkholderia tuberum]|uniref:Capsular polysaccharide transport system permease protein n=1 Tax=Paraburkholderia tuberum TaxID=157910 RepID=A0A1H1IVX0_9BURK|nr:chain-length determining protein [Paraburkholderia tuberum]SDR41852.1 capsular polysaccharide transport system permease protein [Paraburkholderia tuberum]
MNESLVPTNSGVIARMGAVFGQCKDALFSVKVFKLLVRVIIAFTILSVPYWLLFASDRYVSNAIVIVQRTDQVNGPQVSIPLNISGLAGSSTPNSADQLLLTQYLLSVDMLEKLDAAFDLRSHYSGRSHDPISRMLFKNEPIELFYQYWLSRVDVEYDQYNGVIDIQVQAYDARTAREIVEFMIREGQAQMNLIGHQLAQSQVDFLTKEVTVTRELLLKDTQAMIDFQNHQGLVAPETTAQSLNALIATLEAQRTAVQTQLASLPSTLNANQPTVVMLRKNLAAIEQQIMQKRAELASPSKKTLNYTVEEFQRLQMQVDFARDLYKTALSALEQGRLDAARTLKMVSVLQTPTKPVYPVEPSRLYNALVTLLIGLALIGVLKLTESIILDHVD